MNLAEKLTRAIARAMDHAGTMPAKDAVKIHPNDWRAVVDHGREAAALIASQAARIRELEAEIAALKEGKFWRDELLKASLADRKRAIAALSRLDARFVEAEADTNSETGTLGETFATIDVSHLRKITAAAIGCQCGNCTEVSHASDCAVHNEPALPAGPCDCRARAALKGETP